MIVYNVKQHKVDMTMSVLDKKGLEVPIDVTVVYKPVASTVSQLHTDVGKGYEELTVIPYTRDIVREIVGQYTAQELYSTKRDQLKTKCEKLLSIKLAKKRLFLEDVLIRDVNLPKTIKEAILRKEQQEEDNKTAQKKEQYEEYTANALRKKGLGKKDYDISIAQGKAESIRLINKELAKSKEYINLVNWKGYAEHGKSPWGENNMFGVSPTIFKGKQ